jgi:hypothetical protein
VETSELYVREREDNHPKPRTVLEFAGDEYDFPITDPRWRHQARTEGAQSLPSAEIVDHDEEILFTVSLGEASNKDKKCYKIAAAIFTIDSDQLFGI